MPTWPAKHFGPSEFRCHCQSPDCDEAPVNMQLVGMLDRARAGAGIPFVITSGVRCPRHNAFVGGSPSSSHISGLAVDIRATSGQDRMLVVRGLLEAGFRRIGIARGFVHADIDPDKMASLWTY